MVHGGLHACLADGIMTAGARTLRTGEALGHDPALLGLTVTYHRPIPIDGTPITKRGEVRRRAGRVIHAEAEVDSAAGKVLSTGRGIFATSASGGL
jgi:acyl-coenzyme A thioesterase PaaI-like protein